MKTYGQQFIDAFDAALESLTVLSHQDYSEEDVRHCISVIGAKAELFLKSIAFPSKNPRHNFASFIDEMVVCGVLATHIQYFHDLRDAYNDAKHDPNVRVTLIESINIINNARKTVAELISKNPGLTTAPVLPQSRRLFWIAAWDHYIDGDTEIHIILPGESQHWLGPPTLDIIYIKIDKWDAVKSELADIGVLRDGRDVLPEQQYTAFQTDSDFLQALVYEGEYRELLATLGKHEHRQKLLPGLNRQDSRHSMVLAFLLASIDVAPMASIESIKTDIQSRAFTAYAVPPNYRHTNAIAGGFIEMLSLIPISEWPKINGPIWLTKEKFDSQLPAAIAKHPDYQIIITSQYGIAMMQNI